MKKLLFSVAFAAMILLMGSCRSSKEVAYLQNIDSISLDASRGLYDARIMPKDLLTITVSTSNPDAAKQIVQAFEGSKQVTSFAQEMGFHNNAADEIAEYLNLKRQQILGI